MSYLITNRETGARLDIVPEGEHVVFDPAKEVTPDFLSPRSEFTRIALVRVLSALDGLGVKNEDPTPHSIDQVLGYADREFNRYAELNGTRVVEHEWLLLPNDRFSGDPGFKEAYQIQRRMAGRHYIPKGYMLAARVACVDAIKETADLNKHPSAEIASTRHDRYLTTCRVGRYRAYDLGRPQQFVRTSAVDTHVDIDPYISSQ